MNRKDVVKQAIKKLEEFYEKPLNKFTIEDLDSIKETSEFVHMLIINEIRKRKLKRLIKNNCKI